MLPYFPNIVEKRARLNRDLLDRLVKQKAPMLSGIAAHFIHEGAHTDIVREDGSTDRTKIQTLSGEIEQKKVKRSDFNDLTIRSKMEEMAKQFAEGMSRNLIETLSESADKVGNVVDGKGQPLSPDTILEALDRIEIEFNSDGSYDPPSIIVSPEQAERLSRMAGGADAAAQEARLSKIMERKRSEYRLREAGRVLAG